MSWRSLMKGRGRMHEINPRPGAPVAIAEEDGRLLLYAPGAWYGAMRRAYGQAGQASDEGKEGFAHERTRNDSGDDQPER